MRELEMLIIEYGKSCVDFDKAVKKGLAITMGEEHKKHEKAKSAVFGYINCNCCTCPDAAKSDNNISD